MHGFGGFGSSPVDRFKISIFGVMGKNGQLITLENETFDAVTFRLFLEKTAAERRDRSKRRQKEKEKEDFTSFG